MKRKWAVEMEREDDGRWVAEIRELPGCMTYGKTRNEVMDKVKTLSLRVLDDGYAGWTVKKRRHIGRQILSVIQLAQSKFAFHDGEEVGPKMLARIAKRTGLEPEDL